MDTNSIILNPAIINAKIAPNSSKSYNIRAIASALLCDGTTKIYNSSDSMDTDAAYKIINDIGASVIYDDKYIEIKGYPPSKFINSSNPIVLDCMEAGLNIVLFAFICALYNNKFILNANGSLANRPLQNLDKVINSLGAVCKSNSNYPPITVDGIIKRNNYIEIDAKNSSKILSGLLFVLPICNNDSTIKVDALNSKPYIDLTIDVLNSFGILIENNNYKDFFIKGCQQYKSCDIHVESDWSGAAFFLVAGAISGRIEISNLNLQSKQGDKVILDILEQTGANIYKNKDSVIVEKNKLNGFTYNSTDTPDLFPPLLALACNCEGISKIYGVDRLINKESNRAETLLLEFKKLNADIAIENNYMIIKGKKLSGGTVESHNDHRIAMALGIGSINAKQNILINNYLCVNKSYPNFFSILKGLYE